MCLLNPTNKIQIACPTPAYSAPLPDEMLEPEEEVFPDDEVLPLLVPDPLVLLPPTTGKRVLEDVSTW